MGQHVLEFGQKDISKKYSGTGPRVIVTLGPTTYSKGPVPCSEAQTWELRFKWSRTDKEDLVYVFMCQMRYFRYAIIFLASEFAGSARLNWIVG